MTTTSSHSGLGPGEKSSSRVLRPPGGASSDIFGTSAPEPQRQHQRQQYGNRGSSNIFGSDDHVGPRDMAKPLPGTEEHKIYGKGRNQSQFNPITGAPYDESPQSAAAARASPAATPPVAAVQPEQAQTASPSQGAAAQVGQGDTTSPAKIRSSSRVVQPPGGPSQPLW